MLCYEFDEMPDLIVDALRNYRRRLAAVSKSDVRAPDVHHQHDRAVVRYVLLGQHRIEALVIAKPWQRVVDCR